MASRGHALWCRSSRTLRHPFLQTRVLVLGLCWRWSCQYVFGMYNTLYYHGTENLVDLTNIHKIEISNLEWEAN